MTDSVLNNFVLALSTKIDKLTIAHQLLQQFLQSKGVVTDADAEFIDRRAAEEWDRILRGGLIRYLEAQEGTKQ